MSFRFFQIPARSDLAHEEELNKFLRTHRVLSVDRRWVDQGENSYGALCVDFLETQSAPPGGNGRAFGGKNKIDYRVALSPEDFAVFAKLRGESRGDTARWRAKTSIYELSLGDHRQSRKSNNAASSVAPCNEQQLKQQHLAGKHRRRATPRKRGAELRFDTHRELLELLIERILNLGRLPFDDELDNVDEVREKLGSIKRALALIRRVSDGETWDNLGEQQAQDMLVYLALSRFGQRPKLAPLPLRIQRDIKAFFKSYSRACEMADRLLFRAGDAAAIDEACQESSIGKLLPKAGLRGHPTF